MDRPTIYLFALFSVITFLFTFLIQDSILNNDIYYSYYQDQFSTDQIDGYLKMKKDWIWVSYALTPLFLFIKLSLIGFCVWIGLFLNGKNLSFKSLFVVVLKAEVANFVLPIYTLITFGIIYTDYQLSDFKHFSPLSLASVYHLNEAEPWIKYPLSVFSLFELLYIFLLSYFLAQEDQAKFASFWDAFKLVIISYGAGLMLWVLLVTFYIVSQ